MIDAATLNGTKRKGSQDQRWMVQAIGENKKKFKLKKNERKNDFFQLFFAPLDLRSKGTASPLS